MNQTIWIARHGNRQDFVDPDWIKTAKRPFDPPLSTDGVEQAKELGQHLVGEGIAHIFSSPFLRTVETAYYVAEALDLPIKVESGLSELLNILLFSVKPELLPLEVLAERFPKIDLSYTPRVVANYPEKWQQPYERFRKTIRCLTAEFPENFLIVTHSSPVLNMTRELQSTPKFHRSPCSLVKLVRQGEQWKIELKGDTSHLTNTGGEGTQSKLVRYFQYANIVMAQRAGNRE